MLTGLPRQAEGSFLRRLSLVGWCPRPYTSFVLQIREGETEGEVYP